MGAKEYLKSFLAAIRLIDIRLAGIRRMRELAAKLPGSVLTPGKGVSDSRVEYFAVSLADEETAVLREYNKAMLLRRDIEITLSRLPNDERSVLELRYIGGKGWRDISEELQREERQLHRVHNRGVTRVDAALSARRD
jgi:DNA-directed RNA polymerase specialized sigma24 family protein